ncbi:hypothetical protein PIB30_031306 [Stylosanthes scabra]|uniref:Uncharacterized protein n=1 Tax=Stylosanthes scabra TaxID=79078 RepID=A0ABU6QD76_9FABA|nr:hypothetical protein [Stylosanthes scabra]
MGTRVMKRAQQCISFSNVCPFLVIVNPNPLSPTFTPQPPHSRLPPQASHHPQCISPPTLVAATIPKGALILRGVDRSLSLCPVPHIFLLPSQFQPSIHGGNEEFLLKQPLQTKEAKKMVKHTSNAAVTSLGKPSMDFSRLDEKLGDGVVEDIWRMIRDAVAQEMHQVTTTLSDLLKVVSPLSKTGIRDSKLPDTAPLAELSDVPMVKERSSRCKGIKRGQISQVKRTLLYEEKLPPGRPWLYYSAYDPHMDEEDMPLCLDLAFRPTKGMKFFGPELAFAAYIFGNKLNPEEELVTNAHCDGTRKTLHKLMPGKQIMAMFLS